MFQQIIALLVILIFIIKIIWQKKKNKITANEFIFWFVFLTFAAIAILFLKNIDKISYSLGFSASGIDILLYFSLIFLFYIIFKMRLNLEKLDRDITKLTREIALKEVDKNKD
jgi:hypothetical protein